MSPAFPGAACSTSYKNSKNMPSPPFGTVIFCSGRCRGRVACMPGPGRRVAGAGLSRMSGQGTGCVRMRAARRYAVAGRVRAGGWERVGTAVRRVPKGRACRWVWGVAGVVSGRGVAAVGELPQGVVSGRAVPGACGKGLPPGQNSMLAPVSPTVTETSRPM